MANALNFSLELNVCHRIQSQHSRRILFDVVTGDPGRKQVTPSSG